MANGRNFGKKGDLGRDPGGFTAMPWSVQDCPAFSNLSHPARSLLWEIARQFVRDNNGRLLASRDYLSSRGWKSADVIQRAKNALIEGGFIFETVKGHRPNKASWYAVTWRALDKLPGYDEGAVASFERGAYRQKNAGLAPPRGTGRGRIAPPTGTGNPRIVPSRGAIRVPSGPFSVPSDGHHLEVPSPTTAATHSKQPGPTTNLR